jgi:hypothetical protein
MKIALLIALVGCGPTTRDHEVTIDAAAVVPDVATATVVDSAAASGPVDVFITADNAYSFGYGDAASITHFTPGTRATVAGDIFNCPVGVGPEHYTVPAADAPDGAYLYIISWDDHAVTQGVIGQFTRDTGTVLTGDARFEVCATGVDYATGPSATTGPALVDINAQIAACNAGSGTSATTSMGWVSSAGATTPGAIGKLAVGEANDASTGTFPIACAATPNSPGIASAASWMWYDPMDGQAGDAFHSDGTNRFKAFLIFRLAAGAIIE